jgi:hypothetical protein
VTGLIPSKKEHELPPIAKAGVSCDACHVMTKLTGEDGPLGEQGNASFLLDPGRRKYAGIPEIMHNYAHQGGKLDFYSKSEYCATCHTVAHPTNGLRIEHTYDEWKRSVYAEKGIQCQDCHMRSVEDAVEVARTLERKVVKGKVIDLGPDREIHPHWFVGGNANAERLTGGKRHAAMAVARLSSAAKLEVRAPAEAGAGAPLMLEVIVTNVAAGHDLPTSLTELRRMWVHVVAKAGDRVLHESGGLDEHGEIREGAIRFGAELVDEKGNLTFRPWEAAAFRWKRTVPPKGSTSDFVAVRVPPDLTGEISVRARLLYRSAPPHVVHEVMGKDAFDPVVVEMAEAEVKVPVR